MSCRKWSRSQRRQILSQPVTWFAAGKLHVDFTINVDPLSAIMLAMITFIATWIAIFSSATCRGDRATPGSSP